DPRTTSLPPRFRAKRKLFWSGPRPPAPAGPRPEGGRLPRLEPRLDRPVLLGREAADLALALADDAHGDRLHAARREPAAHLVPEQRRELVADQPVEDAARLLRVEAVLVELAGLLERFEDRLL